MSEKLLYTDLKLFEQYKAKEDKVKEIINELMQLSEKALGITKVSSIKKYLDNPKDYLVNEYWTLYCSHKPQHLNKTNVFVNETNIDLSILHRLKKELDNTITALHEFAPVIDEDSITYKVNKDSFNKYLDPLKKDHYKALEDFFKCAKRLQQFEPYNKDHFLARYSESIHMVNIEASINKLKFVC